MEEIPYSEIIQMMHQGRITLAVLHLQGYMLTEDEIKQVRSLLFKIDGVLFDSSKRIIAVNGKTLYGRQVQVPLKTILEKKREPS